MRRFTYLDKIDESVGESGREIEVCTGQARERERRGKDKGAQL